MFHGLFLLAFVLLLPSLIHRIPLAALGAMLVYTGFRLANPYEFLRIYKLGSEQLVVFVVTIIATLATDLLIGVGIGIATKIGFHLWNGVKLKSFFKADVEGIAQSDKKVLLIVNDAAIFSNWLGLNQVIQTNFQTYDLVTLDFSKTRFVDHTVMEKLHLTTNEAKQYGKELQVIGLEQHRSLSGHPLSAKKHI